MGKQRTPQGQRPGRRMPERRVPAGLAAPAVAEAPSEAIMEAEPEMNQDSAEPNAPQAEAGTLEASPAATEAPAAATEEPTAKAQPEVAEEISEPEPEAVASEEPAAEAEAAAEEPVASDEERAEVPAAEPVLPDPLLPVAALAAASPVAALPAERPAQARQAHSAFRFAFAPARIDVEGIGVVLANYVHNESVAAFSHMRALSAARSPAELIRLNVTEMQRAADASLTCWSDIARRAARSVPLH